MGVKLQSALGGSVELNAPSTASNFTMTVPAGNGTVATTDQLTNFRNRIINGDMRIDQRNNGSSSTVGGGYNTVDRFKVGNNNNTGTVQRITSTLADFQNSVKYTASASCTFFQLGQQIEFINCSDLQNKTITISFRAKANNTRSGSTALIVRTRTVAGVNGAAIFAGTNVDTSITLTTSDAYYTVTRTLPSTYGALSLEFTLGSHISGDGFEITGVQLEKGTVATAFEYRPFAQEITMCERYYQRTDWWGRGTLHTLEDSGWNARSGVVSHTKRNGYYDAFWNYRVEMRADPTTIFYGSTGTNKVRVEIPGVNNKESNLQIEASVAGRNGIYIRHNELANGADGEYTSSSGNALMRVNLELTAEL